MHKRIALFLHQPYCSVQSGNGIIKALSSEYTFKIFTRQVLEDDFFDDVDMICFPGGLGDADKFNFLTKENSQRIKEFVNAGGKYLGICMGAYWAGSHYFDILDDVDAVQYMRRPNADTRRPHAKNIEVTWLGNKTNMFWYDGCALVGNSRKFKTVAKYANGDNMAIIQNNIGLIGCHPESEPHWYNSYSWMKGRYHNGEHHKLLLDFVNTLMENK
jgi:glutamine amidotransferase-like uncharacterized protein